MRELRDVERVLLGRIESAAAIKGAELKNTVRVSLGVAVAVIFLSIAHGALRSRAASRGRSTP